MTEIAALKSVINKVEDLNMAWNKAIEEVAKATQSDEQSAA